MIEVPEWVSEEEVRRIVSAIYGVGDRLSADELRKILGVELAERVEIPSKDIRRKDRDRIKWLYSTLLVPGASRRKAF